MLKRSKLNFGKASGWAGVCLAAFLILTIAAPREISALQGYKAGFETMEHPELLPFWLPDGTMTKQFITYDNTGDNGDGGLLACTRYIDSNGERVIFDEYGPGCLYRQQMNTWQQQPWIDPSVVRIKYYFDNETTPRLNKTINEFWGYHQAYTFPFTQPLMYFDDLPANPNHPNAFDRMGVCYYPFPFQQRLKVTLSGPADKFQAFGWYQYTYLKYPTAAEVQTWAGTSVDSPTVRSQWNNIGGDPKSTSGNIFTTQTLSIPRNGAATVLNLTGKGSIASLKINLNPYSADTFYNVKIKIYWDGSAVPSVDLPLGYFFGGGAKDHLFNDEVWNVVFKTLFVGYDNATHDFYSYFPMPYWSSARIDIENNSNTDLTSLSCDVNYKPGTAYDYPNGQAGYFCAKRTVDNSTDYWSKTFQETGRGKVVAISFMGSGWGCDGDEFTYIDDSKTPQMHGDGSEDDHNMGWGGDKYQKALWGSHARFGDHGGIQRDFRVYMNESYIFNKNININYEIQPGTSPNTDTTIFYYKWNDCGMKLTDRLDVGNSTSEASHGYTISNQTWFGTISSNYDGLWKNLDLYGANDDGRSNKGYSQFTVNIDPGNTGVKLRKRVDRKNNNIQKADVYVDGIKVTEQPWYICDLPNAPDNQRWIDADFEIPASYTSGKSSITVKIVYLDATDTTNGINEFYYWVYSHGRYPLSSSFVHDDFNGGALDPEWGWVREDNSKWSLTANPGKMRITCQAGDLFINGNNAKNLLLRNAPYGDWTMKTMVQFNPSVPCQQAGLIVYKDDDNYIKLIRAFTNLGSVICGDKEIDQIYTQNAVMQTAANVYFKIVKSGTTYSLYYNLGGGADWIPVAQYAGIDFGDSYQVGLIDFGSGTAINADFDWFEIGAAGHADDFSSGILDPAWSWVREDSANWSLTANPGQMRITLQGQDLWGSHNTENILLRTPGASNWSMITKLNFNPTQANQQAGPIAYVDDDHYLKLIRYNDGGTNRIRMDLVSGASYTPGTGIVNSSTAVFLKMTKSGTTYTAYYNLDGSENWSQIDQFNNVSLASPRVGLIAQNTAGVSADFDWFDIRENTDDFNSGILNPAWSWIREDSANWSLTANPGQMRITLQGQDLWGGHNTENILLRTPGASDWSIITKLNFNPTQAYQQAGPIAYANDDHYLKLIRFYDGSAHRIRMDLVSGATYTPGTGIVNSSATVYLKMTKSGATYTAYYNLDGSENWSQLDQFTNVSLTSPMVGLIAQNTAGASADFDWFEIR